jgi:UDP-N-acetylmuramyl tripeptide synthase
MVITNLLKIFVWLLRRFTSNSATALPGVLLEDYFPRTLRKMLSGFDKTILITGTNGKTTTTQMICHLLEQNGIDFVTNKSGSNLLRGIAASVLDQSNFWGKPKSNLGIFEIEEGSFRRLVKFMKPNIVIVTNIFRDQLDAYGEIDKTYRYIREAIENSNNPILILNGNDERVKSLEITTKNKVVEIKLAAEYLDQIKFESAAFASQLTKNNEPNPNAYTVKNIKITDDLASTFDIEGLKSNFLNNKTKVPGLHNAINAACAVLAIRELIEDKSLNLDLSEFQPVFGRGEIIKVKSKKLKVKNEEGSHSELASESGHVFVDKEFQILLAKNPAGMNLNLHLLENVKNPEAVLILLNDKIADGKDVSWIWDVDFSLLKKLGFKKIYLAGSRKWDLAIRMKYEDINVEKVFPTIADAVQVLNNSNHEKIFVLPTYTAMLELRKQLRKYGDVKQMWE